MSNLLYLVHRLPYPPNKGDKVRSYHLLKHLCQQHRVFLGTFVDDHADEAYIDTVREICPDVHVVRLNPSTARLRSLSGLLTHQALSLRYYRDPSLQAWVNRTLANHRIDAAIVFSSVMAQYVPPPAGGTLLPMLVDFVDVDSAKWTQYAVNHKWPLSWLYRREGERLLAYERAIAARARRSFFVTEKEMALFREHGPRVREPDWRHQQWRRPPLFFARPFPCVALCWQRRPPGRNCAGFYRRHGLLAQHRRRDLVCATHPA